MQLKERFEDDIATVHALLTARGLVHVDSGAYGAVYRNRAGEMVKIFDQEDTCYLRFLKIVYAHPDNPHFPRIRRLARFTQGPAAGLCLVKMEPLTPLPEPVWLQDVGFHYFVAQLFEAPLPQPIWRRLSPEERRSQPDVAEDWADAHPDMAAALLMIAAGGGECDNDIYRSNVMLRDKTWVFIDPLALS